MIRRATTLKEIRQALDPRPLEMVELSAFFEETSDARDLHLGRRHVIAGFLDRNEKVKVLFFGHGGTGKSTELTKLQEELAGKFLFVNLNVAKEVQPSQVTIENLLVLIVEAVARQCRENLTIDLNEKTLQAVYHWFSETFKTEDTTSGAEIKAGAGISTKDALWGKLLGVGASLTADIRSGSKTVHRTITKENKRLAELSHHCNLLISEACLSARSKSRELVLVVESLDKAPICVGEEVFIHNSGPLADLSCKCVFAAPIWLLCNPRASAIDAPFKKTILPMIKVRNVDGTPDNAGREVIKSILGKRMDLQQLVDGGGDGKAIGLAIDMTGGVLRHLFDVLLTAAATAEYALLRKRRAAPVIVEDDVRYALDQLKSDLIRRLGVLGLPEEYQKKDITTQSMLDRLREIVKAPCKLDSDQINLLLIEAHAVVEYNGSGWHAAHPLIAEYISSLP
jgi:hypothetical protein